ncbi:MAG: RsmE family RNA methyltransferase [Clostridia bacterium]
MARRYIVRNEDIVSQNEDIFEIIGSEVCHMQVTRKKVFQKLIVNEYLCEILEIKKNSIILKKLMIAPKFGEPNISITLYIGLLKNDKIDFVIQKATEIGVKNIVCFFSKNVVVKLDTKNKEKRKEKLQVIANEACKQCGRTDSVKILDFVMFSQLKCQLKSHELVILAYENEKQSLKDVLHIALENKVKDVALVIGAEGGFDISEVNDLQLLNNVSCVSLGTRILRAETAALNLLSITMYELEE